MKPAPTTDALIRLVHRYYPAGIEKEDPRYTESEEAQRLKTLLKANTGGTPEWNTFIQRLRGVFPDCSIWDTTPPGYDPCFSCRVSHPGFVEGASWCDDIVCLLSQLAPVYALYASHSEKTIPPEQKGFFGFPPFPLEFQPREEKLAGLIESTFGVTRLSNDVLFTPVPDLVPRTANFGLGEAQLIDCLFTPHRW